MVGGETLRIQALDLRTLIEVKTGRCESRAGACYPDRVPAAPMPPKLYLTAQQLLEDSFRLGAKVLASGFRPSFIVAIWRGGADS